MPIATLSNYLAGRDMKAEALVTLAEVCRVSLEWLATGRGEPGFGFQTLAMHTQTPEGPRPARMKVTIGQRHVAAADAAETTVLAAEQAAAHAAPDPAAPPRFFPMFGTMDMELMAECLEAASGLLKRRGGEHSWRRIIQIACLLYDVEKAPDTDAKAE